jgi:pimeloyl-ACP methyl ester carboxylesterase
VNDASPRNGAPRHEALHDRTIAPPFRSLPAAVADSFAVVGDAGLGLVLYRLREGRHDGPVLLWGHCGSAAAGSYLPLLADLARDFDVFAFDARGHGGSDAPLPRAVAAGETPLYHPDRFARDVATMAQRVARLAPGRPIHYAAHSLNAAAFLRLGGCMTADFAAIPWGRFVLFEPPLFPPPEADNYAEATAKNRLLVARTVVRRRAWPSREALVDYLAGRGIFAAFSRADLATHIAATLRPNGAGYELACSPEIEATMYAAFMEDTSWRGLRNFPQPERIHLIGADPGPGERDWVTAVIAGVAHALPAARFSTWQGHGHFMVFEDSPRAGKIIREWFATS